MRLSKNPDSAANLNSNAVQGLSPETFEDMGQKAKEREKQWWVREENL